MDPLVVRPIILFVPIAAAAIAIVVATLVCLLLVVLADREESIRLDHEPALLVYSPEVPLVDEGAHPRFPKLFVEGRLVRRCHQVTCADRRPPAGDRLVLVGGAEVLLPARLR